MMMDPSVNIDKIVQQLAAGNQNMSQLVRAMTGLLRISSGTLVWTAAATVTVSDAAVETGSTVLAFPTNTLAGTLVGSVKSPYHSASVAGTSFTLSTANGAAATGGETMAYLIFNAI